MNKNVEKVQTAEIDEISKKQMAKQVAKGISNDMQMRRTMLNFFAEFYAELKKFNENIQTLSRQHLFANMTTIKENLKKEK